MSPRIVKALIKKEFLQVARDPASVFVILVLPMILMFIFGYGVNLDVGRFKVAVVMENTDPQSVSFYQAFSNSRYFEALAGRDLRAWQDEITAGRVRAIIVLPADFGRKLRQARSPDVLVVTDGTDPNTANFVRAYVQMTIMNWQANNRLEAGGGDGAGDLISLETRAWYNPEITSRFFLLPGSLAIILTITGVIMTAMVIAREWERGTMESLIATPASVVQIILAKLLTYLTLSMVSLVCCWFVSVRWYGIPFRGSLAVLLLLGAVFLFTALGQGLLISTVTRSQYHSADLALVSGFLPSFLLSGVIFEIASMPYALRLVTRLIPARYFVSSLQAVFLAGNVWAIFWPSLLAMALLGVVFFVLTLRKTVKKVA